jgi:hypothetical protein
MAITRTSECATEQSLGAHQGLGGRRGYLNRDELTGARRALEVDRLVMPAAPPKSRLVGPAGPFDQNLDLTPDEPLRPILVRKMKLLY